MLSNELNVVVFSKDRASQLELLLRSFLTSCKEGMDPSIVRISVVWLATNDKFRLGYEQLKTYLPTVNWIEQTEFKKDVVSALDPKYTLTMFLVDDDVFIGDFSLTDKEIGLVKSHTGVVATSLRLWEGSTYCYPINKEQKIPEFVKSCVWKWEKQQGDWGYPMSVDGNVYRTGFIHPLCTNNVYRNPNEFEAMLMSVQGKPEYMVCYRKGSKLLNVPANLVQDVFPNRHSNKFSVESLNDRYLAGEVIDLANITGLKPNTPHYELEYHFIPLPG
jgi:hypothetical protein